ncbi:phosphonate ABC transporter, permease protein PhnE [Saccharopolyspora sp. 5N102]|uniref:phosphonate ABC transporter, permease protein PhnE n=1 Tax=Saccharopolyspora sp. 5N102 TaxID=3375155 RepID=UPI0037A77FF4
MNTKTAEPGVAHEPRVPRNAGRLRFPAPRTVLAAATLLALVGLGIWSLIDLRINIATVVDSYSNASSFVRRIWPLEFPPVSEVARQVGMTLSVVLLATLLSVVLSIPLAVAAAANTKRTEFGRMSARATIVVARVVPDVVMAIIFVRFFGLGVLPGVLAMGLHSVGMVGKLYADAIEQIDPGPREALRAAGASRAQQLVAGVFPLVLPSFVAVGLHRFDINLRVSAILGFVGVAGVGMEMSEAFARLNFALGVAWALILLVLCLLVEWLSATLRRALLRDESSRKRTKPNAVTALIARRSVPMAASHPGPGSRQVSPPWSLKRLRRYIYGSLCMAAVVWALVGSGVLESEARGGLTGLLTTLDHFWPPGAAGAFDELMAALQITIQIGFAATLLGAVLAIPAGSLAARNVAPNHRVYLVFRGGILAVRAMPELVLAIVLVVIVGLGPVAGTLALAIGATGLLGKLIADSLEEVDPGPAEALRATGASRLQVYFAATLPQALAAVVGNTLYQLDVNVRAATLLGIVGGGGIGFFLLQSTRTREYEVVTLIMLMTFAVVLVLELTAMWLRRLLR